MSQINRKICSDPGYHLFNKENCQDFDIQSFTKCNYNQQRSWTQQTMKNQIKESQNEFQLLGEREKK